MKKISGAFEPMNISTLRVIVRDDGNEQHVWEGDWKNEKVCKIITSLASGMSSVKDYDFEVVDETREFPRVKIKSGWEGAGREGVVLGETVLTGQEWVPMKFDDEEDPEFFKKAGLEFIGGE